MRVGSLCTGYGGLDAAVGGELAWVSDTDRGASALLAHRYPDVPNLGDLTAADWAQVEPVDVITAGFPCQPFSDAGKRKGAADERAIWPWIAAAVRVVRPRAVVLENVVPVLRHEFGRVASDLAALGYDLQWTCVRASDVGAPHRRERLFVVARHADGARTDARAESRGPRRPAGESGGAARDTKMRQRDERPDGVVQGARRATGGAGGPEQTGGANLVAPDTQGDQGRLGDGNGGAAADTDGDGPQSVGRQQSEQRDLDRCGGADTAWGAYEPAIRRWEHTLGRPAPTPTADGRLSPRFVEWMMGLPPGWVTDVPGLSRTAQLKLLGNGVVPQQAAYALRLLGGAP